MPQKKNIIGHRISALRQEQGLTQAMLAARCGMLGWDVAENVVTKIETQIRCVTDLELLCLAQALNVPPEKLLPPQSEIKKIVASAFRR
jgi:transcriptional regulator with XRE-family HTH domain